MLERALLFVLTLTSAGAWSSSEAAVPFTPAQSTWRRIDSQHFEIHFLPALAGELARVTRSAERAYDRISGRLNFTLPTKVPLVALGYVAFDYIQSRWGPGSIRRFINALIVPRVDKTYDAVFELTPAEFDAAFRHYAERRFGRNPQ